MRSIFMTGAALLALAGCGGGTGEADRGNAAAPAQAGIAAPDGRGEVRSDAAFSGLPDGIPAYPRIKGGGAIQMGGADDGAEMRVMAFRTDDPPADVVAFYAEAAGRARFRVVNRGDAGPTMVLGLARDDGEALNVTATATSTGTSVQIMTGRERSSR